MVAVYPSPNTVLSDIYGDTTGRRRFDPYLSDWSDTIKDKRGRVRLHLARSAFFKGTFDFADIKKSYQMWVGLAEFGKINVKKDGKIIESIITKLPKRGNDIYCWKLKKRLGFLESLGDAKFFNPKDRNLHGATTQMLFITLTWDPNSCDLETAWSGHKVDKIKGVLNTDPYNPIFSKRCKPENVGDHYLAHAPDCPCVSCRWNRWITAMRKRYGRIKVFRNYEAFGEAPDDGKVHADGYPHIHAVLLFEDFHFPVSFLDKSKHFRLLRADKSDIANLWQFHVDVEACYSVQGAMGYIKKYLSKTYGATNVENVYRVDSDKAELTVSLLWLFRKQSFAISGGLSDLMTYGVIQTDFSDFDGLEFEWAGVFTANELNCDPNVWYAVIPGD